MKNSKSNYSVICILIILVVGLSVLWFDEGTAWSSSGGASFAPGYPNPAGVTFSTPPPIYPFNNPIPTFINKSAFTLMPTAPTVGGAGPGSSSSAVTTSYSRQRSMNSAAWSRSNNVRR